MTARDWLVMRAIGIMLGSGLITAIYFPAYDPTFKAHAFFFGLMCYGFGLLPWHHLTSRAPGSGETRTGHTPEPPPSDPGHRD